MSQQVATQTHQQPKNTPPPTNGVLQRKCACGQHTVAGGECAECRKKRLSIQRQATNQTEPATVPPIVHEVLRSPGQPLDATIRAYMEPRFGQDFSQVRVHTDAKAADSARVVNALAYTVGKDVVFDLGQYAPDTAAGRRLVAHELTHVVQQSSSSTSGVTQIATANSPGEREAAQAADNVSSPGKNHVPTEQRVRIQIARQWQGGGGRFGGGGASGSFGTPSRPATPFKVCARALQISPYGNHAYIEAPPYRYAIISPTCPGKWTDNPLTGTGGQKWDNSPDPCGKTPACIPCNPAPGVTNVASCLRRAFTAYANPSFYRLLGPNSNTFAGTLARTCCAAMVPKPTALGWVPGWDDAPPGRYGGSQCPPGPTC